jgi:Dihydrodipicolinate synthetase family
VSARHNVVQPRQAVVGRHRLLDEDVEAGAAEMTSLERRLECLLAYQLATGRVNDDRTARHRRQFPGLPVIVYNVPGRTAVDIAPETIARLRKAHDNIVGVKETTKDFEHFSRVLHVAGTDTLLWSGIELLCLPLLSLGGVGFVSATAAKWVLAQAGPGRSRCWGRAHRCLRALSPRSQPRRAESPPFVRVNRGF